MKNLKLAVIGKDVSLSQSPQIQAYLAKELGYTVTYNKLSVPTNEFDKRIDEIFSEYDGLNVTIPYKVKIIKHLSKTVSDALSFGAVNTVKTRDMSGYNTDGLGFLAMLKDSGEDLSGKEVLVLGAGGAGRSVAKKLLDIGANVSIYNRTTEKARAVAEEFKGVKLVQNLQKKPYFAIVNATGVGMHQTVGQSPVTEDIIGSCSLAIDLIYEPAETEFMRIAKNLNKKVVGGGAMLFYQAYFAACIFADIAPDEGQAKELYFKYTGGLK